MAFWLIKSEPAAFSWADQCRNGVEPWTGVRNYQARNNLSAMRCGDRALFYHSVTEKRIMGVVEIVRAAYPDPTVTPPPVASLPVTASGASQKDALQAGSGRKSGKAPKAASWVCVDVRADGAFARPVTLASIKADPALAEMALLKQTRLSVAPVTESEFAYLTRLGGWREGEDLSDAVSSDCA